MKGYQGNGAATEVTLASARAGFMVSFRSVAASPALIPLLIVGTLLFLCSSASSPWGATPT